jgi:predicted regulator of Ras-like GTPase activity (Roadblock/LC7/MglB family)
VLVYIYIFFNYMHNVGVVRANNFDLYEIEHQRIQAILVRIQKELQAELVLLLNRSGQPIVVTGSASNIDITALASLAAANLAATDGLAQLVGERQFSALSHQGSRRSLYISDLLKKFSLVILFDSSMSLGMVRWKIKRATSLLEVIFLDFAQRMEKTKAAANDRSQMPYPQFSDDELEKLLGRICSNPIE